MRKWAEERKKWVRELKVKFVDKTPLALSSGVLFFYHQRKCLFTTLPKNILFEDCSKYYDLYFEYLNLDYGLFSNYEYNILNNKDELLNKLTNTIPNKLEELTSEYEKMVFKTILNKDVDEIWDTEGCEECHDGYKGRIAIHEVLRIDQDIRDALSNGKPKEEIRKLVYDNGNVTTMLQDGLEKVLQGLTTFEEILKLIELEDDDMISNNSELKEAIIENKEVLLEKEKPEGEYLGDREENYSDTNEIESLDI